ncbi:MAG: hypothetical protein WDM76_01905 [Limisphaerales bacterium]
MKRVFSICIFLLMLGMAFAQQPASLTETNTIVTNAIVAGETIEQTQTKAEAGDAEAQFKLATYYFDGWLFVPKDQSRL